MLLDGVRKMLHLEPLLVAQEIQPGEDAQHWPFRSAFYRLEAGL